ncbi:hypothetical protein ACLB1R_31875 [Escherichia coli]
MLFRAGLLWAASSTWLTWPARSYRLKNWCVKRKWRMGIAPEPEFLRQLKRKGFADARLAKLAHREANA